MKNISICLVVFLLVFNNRLLAKNIAMLVGVGNYPRGSDWQQLHAQNDLQLLFETLKQKGFESDNVILLSNEQATKNGILKAILMLKEKASKDDIVYFHFSGHGQQVKDNNGDEIDGYDEALVPFDSPKHYQTGIYEGENLIRDDDLNVFFTQIRTKIGISGQLIISLDACHSGTGVRGFKTARGTDEKMADANYQRQWPDKGNETANIDNTSENAIELAPYICFFSSSSHQLSYEHNTPEGIFGVLTYFLCKSILNSSQSSTYKSVFEQIKSRFIESNALQTPEIEGKTLLPFFGKNQNVTDNSIPVAAWLQPQVLTIHSGSLYGLTEGTKAAVYNIAKQKIGDAVLEDVSAFDATLTLDKPIGKKEAIGAYVKIISIQYKEDFVRIKANKATQQRFLQNSSIHWTDENFDLYIEDTQNHLHCFSSDGNLLMKQKNEEDANSWLQKMLSKWHQNKTVRALNIENSTLKGNLRFKNKGGEYLKNKVSTGTKIKLEITNEGSESFYFSIIDLSPNYDLNVILPFERPASEFFLQSGQSYTSDFELEVSEPLGFELFKLIATPMPLDLTSINVSNTKGLNTSQSGLERLLNQSFLLGAKGINNIQINPNEAMIQSFSLEIVK